MLLKNVGLICEACGAGHHEDCITIIDPTKRMCLCAYTTHPYLSRDQLTPRVITVAVPTPVGAIAKKDLGPTVHQGSDKAPRVIEKVRGTA